MQEFDGKSFWHNGDPADCSRISASNCSFNQCAVRPNPNGWNHFSDIVLRDVGHWNCSVSGAALERVSVHNLKKIGAAPLFFWGSVFNNVRLSGSISGVKINRHLHVPRNPDGQSIWDQRVTAYYHNVDWALDISQAKFPAPPSFEAIPGHLIIRNPATQVLIKRQSLADRDWRTLDFELSAIDIAISWFESGSIFDSVVIVARSEPKYAARDRSILEMLRREGVAEHD